MITAILLHIGIPLEVYLYRFTIDSRFVTMHVSNDRGNDKKITRTIFNSQH